MKGLDTVAAAVMTMITSSIIVRGMARRLLSPVIISAVLAAAGFMAFFRFFSEGLKSVFSFFLFAHTAKLM